MDQEEAPLPASEYPCCIDSLNSLPLQDQGTSTNSPQNIDRDPEIVASTLRQNSINRWSLSTRTIAHYCRLEQIGEGTYGQVYRAQCLDRTLAHPNGGEIVALKKIRLHHPGYWGIPPTVLREIKILKQLQHKNLVKMFEVVSSKGVEDLDWEDEREDEKRLKAKTAADNNNSIDNNKINNSTPVLNSDDSTSKKNDITKGTSSIVSKKKKKDSMSDIEKLRESYKGNLFLSLEYISHDLTGLLDMAYKFSEVQVKSISMQLLQVLEFMHSRNFVHRDLKTSNILITDNFELKLADFGLARCLESSFMGRLFEGEGYVSGEGEFTNKVITLWYRPPELLLGETRYGCAVDIWSAGCIFAEIILGRPIFTGKTEMDQLKLIFDLIGTPTERSWEGFQELKLIRTGEFAIEKARKPRLREKYGEKVKPTSALGLLEKLLELDPKKRCTASRALNHFYFQNSPIAPEDPKELGGIDLGGDGSGYHEFKTKKRRREAKAVAKMAEDEAKRQGLSIEKQKEAFDVAYREHLQKGANADKKKEEKEKQQQAKQQQAKQQQKEESKRKLDQKGRNDQPPLERDKHHFHDDAPPSRNPPRNMHPPLNPPPPNMGNHPRDTHHYPRDGIREMPYPRELNRDVPPPRDMMGRGPRDIPHPLDMGRGPREMPHQHQGDMGRGPPYPFDMGRGPRDMGRGHPNNFDRIDQGGPWNMNMGKAGRRIPGRVEDNWGPPPHLRDRRGPPDQQFRRDQFGPPNDQFGPTRWPNVGDHYGPMGSGRNIGGRGQIQLGREEEFTSRRQHHDDANGRRRERGKDTARDSPGKDKKEKENNDSKSSKCADRDTDRLNNDADLKKDDEDEGRRSRSPNRSEKRRSRERSRDSSRDKDRKKGHRRSHRDDVDGRRHRQEKERKERKSERDEDDHDRRERKRSKESDRDSSRKRHKRSKDSRHRESSRCSDDRHREHSEREERKKDGRNDRDRPYDRKDDGPNWRPPMGRDGRPDDRQYDERRR